MRNCDSGRQTQGVGGRGGGTASAFVLAISGRTGGVLTREGKGFRFSASHTALRPLDGAFFASMAQAEAAAELVATARFGVGGNETRFSALF